jgi:cobalt/nickel transport system ATP-binding protein
MPPLVAVRDLAFHYPDGTLALRGVSFDVQKGERVALLGSTGSGKSTLLQHLNGLLTPDAGSVTVAGFAVAGDSVREVRRRVGLVFQDPNDQLFLPTLLEDVAFGPLNDGVDPHEAAHCARTILEELGLVGLDSRPAHHLSGGERRLAALATVLVSQPELLALDEPTGDLDAVSRARLVRLLATRPETLLTATHDLDAATALCERGVVLHRGAVVADRPLADLLCDRELLERHGLTAPLDRSD